MKDELTGDFEELIVALIYTPAEYDVHCLREAVEGLGTRESALIGIICSRSNRVRHRHHMFTLEPGTSSASSAYARIEYVVSII